jgi:hypothetical protein
MTARFICRLPPISRELRLEILVYLPDGPTRDSFPRPNVPQSALDLERLKE